MTFQKASKRKVKLRCALFGPSGSGKTMSALRIATGITKETGGKIALIDSERGSSERYADRYEFDVCNLEQKTIPEYIQGISEAGTLGYAVLIVDSGSHAWQDLLEEVDRLAKAKYKGNTWSAWSEGTPKQRKLIDSILGYPGHIIWTMRSKTEWTVETNSNGKSTPTRVGLAPEQGKGIEYEFDLLLEMGIEHQCTVIKDRTGKFQDRIIEKPGEEFGAELVQWLSEGEEPPASREQRGKIYNGMVRLQIQEDSMAEFLENLSGRKGATSKNLTAAEADTVIDLINAEIARLEKQEPKQDNLPF